MNEAQAKSLVEHILTDSLLCSARILNTIDMTRPDVLSAFDRIDKTARTQQVDYFSAAEKSGEPITAEILTILTSGLIVNWFEGGAAQIIYARDYLYLLELNPEGFADQVVSAIIRGLEPLARIDLGTAHNCSDLLGESYDEFFSLIPLLSAASHHQLAFECSLICCNLIPSPEDLRFLSAAEEAARLVRIIGNETLLGLCDARLATAIASFAERGERSRLSAFDAIECALLNLPSDPTQRNQAMSILKPWLSNKHYASMISLFVLNIPENLRPPLPEKIPDLSQLLKTLSDHASDAWFNAVLHSTAIYAHIENDRLKLQPQQNSHMLNADWSSWSFRHFAYRNAVPDGVSFLRERDLNQRLFELNHEITHVYSMHSRIGMAIIALRIAALMFEITLRTFSFKEGTVPDSEEFVRTGVAPLQTGDILALAQAEQSLQVSRKIQILQETWEPWFEGIAVFSELAGDPKMDTQVLGFSLTVISQLVDRSLKEQSATTEQLRAFMDERIREAEQLYSDAISHDAYFQLLTYLNSCHSHYLPGYLAVRGVVASWRQTLGRSLSGAEASRILLHVTRFGTGETIPDLGTSLVDFQKTVQDRMMVWLKTTSGMAREDIERFLDYSPTTSLHWSAGQLVSEPIDPEKIVAETEKTILILLRQAMTSLCSGNADVDRVPNANPECMEVLRIMADALTKAKIDMSFAGRLMNLYLTPLNILPIGSVEAPFWLHRESSSLFCIIRTTEIHRDSGTPSYNGLVLGLTPEDFAALEAEYQRIRKPRMTVMRVADLAASVSTLEGRGLGRNLLVLIFGNWCHVQPRGMLFGQPKVEPGLYDEIKVRCLGNPLLSLDAEKIANGAAGAKRTKTWLAEVDEGWSAGAARYQVEPWSDYVSSLADQVLDPSKRTDRKDMSLMLLKFVIDDDQTAQRVFQEGLSGFCGNDTSALRAIIRTLDASARSPTQEAPKVAEELWSKLLQKTGDSWDVRLPNEIN